MIYLLSLFISLCVQFGTVNFPVNYSVINDSFSTLTNTLYNDIQNRGFTFDKKYMVVVGDTTQGNGGGYECFVPLEVLNGSNSSNSVNFRNVYNDDYIEIGVNTPGWVRFKYGTSLNFLFGGTNETSNNITGRVLNPSTTIPSDLTNGILYNEYYPFTYQGIDTFTWSFPSPPVISFNGHASGWADTLEEVDGNYYTILGHSDITNEDSFDLVSSSSSTLEKLLKAIGRLTSSMNDNISYGLGTLISLFQQGLEVVGLDGIATRLDNLFNKVESGVDTTENYIAWVSEPFDAAEFDLAVQNSGFGNFSSLAHTLQTTIDASRVDNTHVYITLDLSNITYFSGFGTKTYDLATYLNGSKDVWQPLLLTFIYATVFWGFFRSIPNIIGGASPVVNTVYGGVKNAK